MAANVTRYETARRPPLVWTTIPYVVNTVSGTMYTSPNRTNDGTPRTRRRWPSSCNTDGSVDMALPLNPRPSNPAFLTDTWPVYPDQQVRQVTLSADRFP